MKMYLSSKDAFDAIDKLLYGAHIQSLFLGPGAGQYCRVSDLNSLTVVAHLNGEVVCKEQVNLTVGYTYKNNVNLLYAQADQFEHGLRVMFGIDDFSEVRYSLVDSEQRCASENPIFGYLLKDHDALVGKDTLIKEELAKYDITDADFSCIQYAAVLRLLCHKEPKKMFFDVALPFPFNEEKTEEGEIVPIGQWPATWSTLTNSMLAVDEVPIPLLSPSPQRLVGHLSVICSIAEWLFNALYPGYVLTSTIVGVVSGKERDDLFNKCVIKVVNRNKGSKHPPLVLSN